jgi:hypothetical protein
MPGQSRFGHNPLWRLFFFLAGACNIWHTLWRIRDGPEFIMGPDAPNLGPFFDASGLTGKPLADTLAIAYDGALWTGVCSAGLMYWGLGCLSMFGGFASRPHHCLCWGIAKVGIAASLLGLAKFGNPGPYTLLFGWLELAWAMGFFLWCKTVGYASVKATISHKMGVKAVTDKQNAVPKYSASVKSSGEKKRSKKDM